MVFVRVSGINETIARINKIDNVMQRELAIAMSTVTNRVAFDAKGFAPYKTGFLRDGIKSTVIRKGVDIIGRITSTAPYSVYQEFGTVRHRAQPFMIPALTKNRDFIELKLGDAVLSSIIKIGAR